MVPCAKNFRLSWFWHPSFQKLHYSIFELEKTSEKTRSLVTSTSSENQNYPFCVRKGFFNLYFSKAKQKKMKTAIALLWYHGILKIIWTNILIEFFPWKFCHNKSQAKRNNKKTVCLPTENLSNDWKITKSIILCP